MTIEPNAAMFNRYEYKELLVEHSKVSLYIDSYKNFGWDLDTNIHTSNQVSLGKELNKPYLEETKVKIYVKRQTTIKNKVELTRLENNFEACIKQIIIMEKKKISIAQIYALTLGVIGILSVMIAFVAFADYKRLSFLAGIIGLINIILPPIVYNKTFISESEKLDPIIQQKYAEIDKICRKGYSLGS